MPRTRFSAMWAYAAYYGFARYLPWSISPGGRYAKAIRARLCARLFDVCGEAVNVEPGVWFGSGSEIRLGHRSGLGKDAVIMGQAHIGDDVMMGPRVMILSTNHNFSDVDRPMNRQGLTPSAPVVIEDDVWIGAGVILLPGRRVGSGAIVAAGCVVSQDVPPRSIVGGNPMRVLGDR